jgi:ribosomal protein S18 acetylase RimI-like enzyme
MPRVFFEVWSMPHTPPKPESNPVIFRDTLRASDREAVGRIISATGFFRPDELDVALELVDLALENGASSGYSFLFAEQNEDVIGYACYGPIACTIGSYDLYWIAVDPSQQRAGIGRRLVEEVERRVQNAGGRHIYIETSGRPQYTPTRKFYERCGYESAAVLKDFYDRNDDKWIWRKEC